MISRIFSSKLQQIPIISVSGLCILHLHIQYLPNCCKHKYNQSIPQSFFNYIFGGFLQFGPTVQQPLLGASSTEDMMPMEYEVELQVAALRTHPIYSAYNNWSRLIILGIIPFLLLVFFNTRIYEDIRERRKRRLR